MLDEEAFQMMKDHVYISNTGRGALIKEEALVNALQNKEVAGSATDVLEMEPGRSDHPYLQFDNVLMTPHISAYTYECLSGMGEKCVTDCEMVAEGMLPKSAVQAESKYVKKS